MIGFQCFKNQYGLHIKISLWKYNFHGKLFSNYKLAWTNGIRNNTIDQKFTPFFDMDNTLLEFLINEMKYIQARHLLGDLYIFKSSQKENGYHVMGTTKLNFKEWMDIINESSCDEFYRTMPLTNDYKSFVLRYGTKGSSDAPKLIKIIKAKKDIRPNSYAHALFLKLFYNVDISKIKNLDKNTTLYDVNYGTLNFLKD